MECNASNHSTGRAWVYFLLCANGHLYIGSTNDLLRRFNQHVGGLGAVYTRMHPPKRLLGAIELPDLRTARQLERMLKESTPTRKQRMAIFASETEQWRAFADAHPAVARWQDDQLLRVIRLGRRKRSRRAEGSN